MQSAVIKGNIFGDLAAISFSPKIGMMMRYHVPGAINSIWPLAGANCLCSPSHWLLLTFDQIMPVDSSKATVFLEHPQVCRIS
jgi:hypothetical protein